MRLRQTGVGGLAVILHREGVVLLDSVAVVIACGQVVGRHALQAVRGHAEVLDRRGNVPRDAVARKVARGQRILRVGVAAVRGAGQQPQPLRQAAGRALAVEEAARQTKLRIDAARCGRDLEMAHGLGQILRHAVARLVADPEPVVRLRGASLHSQLEKSAARGAQRLDPRGRLRNFGQAQEVGVGARHERVR